MNLPERVRQGYDALREGRAEAAAGLLGPAVDDPELARAADLQDLRARVCSLYAQALLESGRPLDAEAPIRDALRIAKKLHDDVGVYELRMLQGRIASAVVDVTRAAAEARERDRVRKTPLAELLAGHDHPLARAGILVQKANVHAEDGDRVVALTLAEEALALAIAHDSVRDQVLARLTIARAAPERAAEALREALVVAEGAAEFNLVGAVARAAEVAGVTLQTLVGPGQR